MAYAYALIFVVIACIIFGACSVALVLRDMNRKKDE